MSPATSTNTRNFPILFNSQLNQEFNNFLSIILKLIILFTLVTLYLEQIIFITTDTSQKTNFTIGNIKTAATFAVNAVNDGGNLGQAIKQTTSKDSLKNIAISGIAAGLTAGILEGISPTPVTAGTSGAGDLGNATTLSDATPTAAPTSPTSLTIDTPTLQGPTFASTATSSPASEVNLASVGSNTANSANTLNTANTVRSISSFSDLTANFQRALTQSAVNGVSSAAAQSAIDGDSFKDSLKLQATNVLINAVGQVGAEQIGLAAHSGQISTPVQLTLHAGLGCAMAAAGSNNCAAGAAAGVAGELIGASLRNQVENGAIQKATAIGLAETGSALAAATLAKPNDGDSVFAGSRIGHNSAEYNSLSDGLGFSPSDEKVQEFDQARTEANGYIKLGKENTQNFLAKTVVESDNPIVQGGAFVALTAVNILQPTSVEEIQLMGLGAVAGMVGRGASSVTVANPIPETFARVVGGSEAPTALGLPHRSDVFVTDAKVLEGLNSSQISDLLTIDPRSSYTIIEFPSKGISGISTPINRVDQGFIGGGRTAGGAPEFAIPNGPIPNNAITKIVR